MTVSIFNCWHCGKSLQDKRAKNRTKSHNKNKKTETELPEDYFHCDMKCKEAYEKKWEELNRPYRQWSDYMCGDRENPPQKFKKFAEKVGWRRHRVNEQINIEDEPEAGSTGRKCGKCGKPGHNARTCERRQETKKKAPRRRKPRRRKHSGSPKKVVKKTKGKKVPTKKRRTRKKKKTTRIKKASGRIQYRCRICKGLGHNARTCDKRPFEANESTPKIEKKIGKYKCGVCSQLGHNARTCPERN